MGGRGSHFARKKVTKSEMAFRATQKDGTTVTIYRSGQNAYVRDIHGIPNKLPISYKQARTNLTKNSVSQVSLTAAQIERERKQEQDSRETFLRKEFPGPLGVGPIMRKNGTWKR